MSKYLNMQKLSVGTGLLLCILLLAGCVAGMHNPVPEALTEQATPISLDNVRFFGDAEPENAQAVVQEKVNQSIASRPGEWNQNKIIEANFLIITGGGPDGAFGAGLLNGMTDGNNRLNFEVVTGVSTGALIAPFAFLGPKYDAILKSVYTETSTKDIIKTRGPLAAFSANALADTKPLEELIASHVTPEFLSEIAFEYSKGRRLFVGTTNLDAQRPVIWNMGAIAAHENEEALQLFRKVLLASAAIPAAFPPVRFSVEASSEIYEELHVDGGTTNNAFFLPLRVGLGPYLKQLNLRVKPTMYVLRNSRSSPSWDPVEEKTLKIARRSISTLIKSSTTGDLYRLYTFTSLNDIGFRVIDVPETFNKKPKELFDPAYMSELYDLGYNMGIEGVNWDTKPPGL